MNNEIRNVMTIVTLARVVESTLWYCLPPRNGSFSVEEREGRFKAMTALTQEGSPFAMNCDNNGEVGATLKEDMQYFIEDVYSPEGRIVTVGLDNVVHVEESLVLELFSTIVKLRGYLESFLHAAIAELEKRGTCEPDFVELVNTDIKYFHAFAGKISTILLSNKFLEINKAAETAMQTYAKAHGGADPRKDPEFNVSNDPSFRMLENEFHSINSDMNAVLNTYGNDMFPDDEFKFARESVYADCEIFTGKKTTTDVNAYFKIFTGYFDKILDANQARLNNMFNDMGRKLREGIAETSSPINARPADAAAPAEEAAPEAEKGE